MSEDRKLGGRDGARGAPCDEWQALRSLAAAGELELAEQPRLSEHLSECAACAADLAREKETLGLVTAQHAEPEATLLASCRAALQDELDREEDRGWIARSLGLRLPASWVSPRPAWSAAILLLIGFCVGLFGPRLLLRYSAWHVAPDQRPAPVSFHGNPVLLAQKRSGALDREAHESNVLSRSASHRANASARPTGETDRSAPPPGSALAAIDLHRATVAGINVLPSGAGVPPEIQLQLDTPRPFTFEGTVDDGDVRNVLLYVLRHGDLFPPNVRLGAVNALSPRSRDPEVHSALSHALTQDASPAVRVSALQALNVSEPGDLIGRMLLDALSGDQDPAVREQAIRTLHDLTNQGQIASSQHMLSVLRDHMRKDPDPYIRSQSAAVVRELVSQSSGDQ